MKDCIPQLRVPVLVKEVGSGISETTARKLKTLPLSGVETAGTGGTSWSKIESLRTNDHTQRSTGETFARWGIPTAESVINCRRELPNMTVIASGGMRTGIEIAKAIALGANAGAMALPVLKAAERSVEHAVQAIETILNELRTTLFVIGVQSIDELKQRGPELIRRAPDLSGWQPK
jgi:isopentenyl-diphosphate delta-isomerase